MRTPRPRVFVSSVVDGFGPFREAARKAVDAVGGEPLLANEDLPSVPTSSRNACLDLVDSSDYLLSIVATRGGWTMPSGKLVIEEEYERAMLRKVPVLGFIQAGAQDADSARFSKRLSDYAMGRFRRTFESPGDLQSEVERALRPLISNQTPVSKPRSTNELFDRPYAVQGMAMLRFVLSPERQEEVIDPVRLGSEAFKRRIQEIGHAADVALFSYERPKKVALEGNDLVILQTETNGRHGEGEHVRVQLSESGDIVIDANVTGRKPRPNEFMVSSVVAIEDMETVLRLCFAFASAFFQDIDAVFRHQSFTYNVALSGLEYRKLERNPQPRNSFTMSMRPQNSTLLSYPDARRVTRIDLSSPETEITRVVELLRRKSEDQ